MNRERYLQEAPFSVCQAEKESFFQSEMKQLTAHHRNACKAYDEICRGISEDGPYLPVSLFKNLNLSSVSKDNIVRQITSSGTSGQQVSRINLDAETSMAQQQALCAITGDFIGGNRIPMLIIDSPDVLRDRTKFSARGAGILGFSIMSSRRFYALTENMEVNWEGIDAFLAKADGGPSFAFGFTYMIWAYFCEGVRACGRVLDLGNCHLIHGGGWKKLQNQKVSDETFRQGLKTYCGIRKVSNYYGMAEQTGSIFMECEEGHLHASTYSDITILHPKDFTPCEIGEWGLIALKSHLPKSYPGHKLLTEDWGRILGEDDCPCGRKGRTFEIQGRIRKAEIRGCSDTFERKNASGRIVETDTPEEGSKVEISAGSFPVEETLRACFDSTVMSFLEELSRLFTKEELYRRYPEIYSLGFWCRKSHMEAIRKRQLESETGEKKKNGIGLVLHIAPSNMPTMFAYSWITSLLAGNPNVVRVSGKKSEVTDVALKGIRTLFEKPEYKTLKESNCFLRFPHGHPVLQELLLRVSGRVIWGGDKTVQQICSLPAKPECVNLSFPDKYSIAYFDCSWAASLSDEEMKHQAHLFYNDTYGADQNACSSPRTVFWHMDVNKDTAAKARQRWWNAVAEEAEHYDLQPWMAVEKYRMLCVMYAQSGLAQNNEGEAGKGTVLNPVKRWGNRLYVVPCTQMAAPVWNLEGKMGLFYETDICDLSDLYPFLDSKVQTIVRPGSDRAELMTEIRKAGCAGVDRVAAPGEALSFDTIWDRKNMIHMLSR